MGEGEIVGLFACFCFVWICAHTRAHISGNFTGIVLFNSEVLDLSIITVEDDSFWEGMKPVKFQNDVPPLDDTVLAVGYPMGSTTVTVTRGVVSAVKMKDISLTSSCPVHLVVQIDAAINPGNSGGPVFNNKTKEVSATFVLMFVYIMSKPEHYL